MAIKIGNSWVSEDAYAHAKAKASGNGKALNSMSEKYPDMNFSTDTRPYKAAGNNNIAIAPNILRQMQNNPEKALEYDALAYDCAQISKKLPAMFAGKGLNLKAHGFIIEPGGGLSSWSITEGSGIKQKQATPLHKKDKNNWISSILQQK